MLRTRYEIDPDFQAILEFVGEMDAELAEIDRLLSDDKLFKLIEAALSKRYPLSTKTGRSSTPVEVILRMLALKHIRDLSYEKTIKNIKESLILRQFCRVYFNPIPNKSTLIRWSNLISAKTLQTFNQRVTKIAIQMRLTQGRKMRTDGTVVETNIHYPSDNSILADGVRVLSRLFQQAKKLLTDKRKVNPQIFRNRNRTARRIARRIDELSRTRTQSGRVHRQQAYQKLLATVEASVKQAKNLQTLLKQLNGLEADKLVKSLTLFISRVEQVINQTQRRVLRQEKVPSSEKLVSLFEIHTDIICRGKREPLVEFGHKVWLDEVDGGIISNYSVLKGNPHDTQQWTHSLEWHLDTFGHPPVQASADRGVFSFSNENYAIDKGVKRVILPKSGYKSRERQTRERQRGFQRGRHWHNGIEGRISVLKRCFGFKRCLYRGESGFERWVGWGVMAHNLTVMSRQLAQRSKKFMRS